MKFNLGAMMMILFKMTITGELLARSLSSAFILTFILVPSIVFADSLYAVEGRRGVITFTSRKPSGGQHYRVLYNRQPRRSQFYSSHGYRFYPVKSKFDNVLAAEAKLHNLDPALVKAVIHIESAFNPRARSPKGAMGLMQLMPATAKRFGVSNAYRPEENVKGGVKYLRLLVDRYPGNLSFALAGYNAGENAVDRYQGIPPYRETQTYVQRVLKAYRIYQCNFSGGKTCVS